MVIKKFIARSITTVIVGTVALISVSQSAIGANKTLLDADGNNISPSQGESHHQSISFGLPKVPIRNAPEEINDRLNDREQQLENRVDRVESNLRDRIPNVLLPLIKEHLFSRERNRLLEWSTYLGVTLPTFEKEPNEISQTLTTMAEASGDRYGLIYISYYEEEGLEFLLFSPGDSQPQTLYTVDSDQATIENLVDKFRYELLRSVSTTNTSYLQTSEQLYQILIEPIRPYLDSNDIEGLIFVMDKGLRNLPMAALHDGEDYLIEDYAIATIPSFVALNPNYVPLQDAPVLAMGAETFPELSPLPGVGLEVDAIADIATGEGFLNETFTIPNLNYQRNNNAYPIVHFATHAAFESGSPEQSYLHLWNDKSTLGELDQLRLSDPPVELLVLSACQTAIGSYEAELGFAGLTIASGVKSALGSLWSVSDQGTMVLMQSFYHHLQTESSRAAALRQAQLDLLNGDLKVVDGQVIDRSGTITHMQLTPDLNNISLSELAHPYYWSGFSMIGQPW